MRNRSAKNIYYGEPKPSELSNKLLGNTDINKKSIIDEFIKDSDVIDLSKRNIGNFHDQLQQSINKKSPMFLWSKERQNNKVRLDNEYQLLILEKIRNLRAISDEYNRLQADEIFSGEFIKNLVANKIMEAEHYFEKAVASHRVELTKMKVDIDLTNSLVDHDQIEKDRKIAENERIRADNYVKYAEGDKIKAEADHIRIKSQIEYTKINMINKAMEEIDLSEFPPAFKTFIFTSFLNVDVSQMTQFELQENMKEFIFQQARAETDRKTAETEDFKNSAEFRKWKNDRAKKDAEL